MTNASKCAKSANSVDAVQDFAGANPDLIAKLKADGFEYVGTATLEFEEEGDAFKMMLECVNAACDYVNSAVAELEDLNKGDLAARDLDGEYSDVYFSLTDASSNLCYMLEKLQEPAKVDDHHDADDANAESRKQFEDMTLNYGMPD